MVGRWDLPREHCMSFGPARSPTSRAKVLVTALAYVRVCRCSAG